MDTSTDKAAESLSYHFRLVIDNDSDSYQHRRAMVAEARESEYPRADLADALKDWAEYLAGLEADDTAGMLARELLTTAFDWIDWHGMAEDYLAEE